MATIEIVQKNIAELTVDCIVCPSHSWLFPTSGAAAAIFHAAGADEMWEACINAEKTPRGNLIVTPGFRLKAYYVIHLVPPVWVNGFCHEEEILRQCYEWSLKKARHLGCKSIAFPLIGAGENGFPINLAWKIALRSVKWYQKDIAVYFAEPGIRTVEEGQSLLAHYVREGEILDKIDRNILKQQIEMLCRIRDIPWKTYGASNDKVLHMAYPQYPDELMDLFDALDVYDYYHFESKMNLEDILPTELSARQIMYRLGEINRLERSGEGIIAAFVKDGTLLKLLLRLDDLLKEHKHIIDYI